MITFIVICLILFGLYNAYEAFCVFRISQRQDVLLKKMSLSEMDIFVRDEVMPKIEKEMRCDTLLSILQNHQSLGPLEWMMRKKTGVL